ncbi:hypothetical protein GCM10011487_04870 [Steroidobacter agaridevorans]|uniref:Uncharacterized protein n=1 Tax=Steroidobacter agaridevorans TaxID=2695856 RepID=A0A829Y5L3_9GAMM|nr:hypothetical protein [Steroidobacter agaridevorans]GFE78487.1 hypothetical protein GCM10011487_04870 [Steroidobacter agaridevorans]GFE89581.1 hypothetical protein GCM10011488_45350 [Steroidobacter agaridevorans]
MSKVVLISVASSVGLGLLSLHLVKQLKEGEATIADLQAQVATLQEQQQREPAPLPRENTPPPEVIAPQPSEVIGTPPKEPPKKVGVVTANGQLMPSSPPNREDRMRIYREHRERQRQLMQDPEYREAMRVQTRGNFARQYPGVIQELGLDSQQAEEFFDLLADQQMRSNEQMQPMWDMEGVDPTDQAAMQERQRKIATQAAENQRKSEAEMAARFGQDKLQAWKEYQSTMGVRFELENLRSTLASSGMPLNEELSKPMLKALAQAQTQALTAEAPEYAAAVSRGAAPALAARVVTSNNFDDSTMERHIEAQRKRNQRTLDALSPYLSFEQREAIEQQQEAQLKMQEAQYRLMRAQRKTDPNSNGTYFVEGSSNLMPLRP